MKNKIKLLPMLIIMILTLQFFLPVISSAYEIESQADGILSLNVELKRDEVDRNQINITATDTLYDIVELKYVHKRIETSDISYFEEDNDDVHSIEITPSRNITASFQMYGYGTYTVYAKNTNGDTFLSRINVHDPEDLPDLTLIKQEGETLSFIIQAISEKSQIAIMKIVKLDDIYQDVDFDTEGTDIEFTKSNNVNLIYTVEEEGLYKVYVKDDEGGSVTRQIYVAENETPIELSITYLGNREVKLNVTDEIANITRIKVAKSSEISSYYDFETKGEEITFTKGKNVEVNYTAPEDDIYTFLIEDEARYTKMTDKRIAAEDTSMRIEIIQEVDNPGNLTIRATGATSNIVELKVAIGENIDKDYFENNGESLDIIPGMIVSANYQVKENCVLNVYIKDADGYTHLMRKTIIVSTGPTINEPPQITLSQNQNNPKQIDVTVSDMDNYIDTIKWAKGSHEAEYFESNGTRIAQGQLGKIIKTEFAIDSVGIYTVFAEDQEGESTVKEINILSIDEVEEPDTTAPVIEGVVDNAIYNDTVKPIVTDEHLASVVLTKDGEVVEDYQNETYIEGEGHFTLTAKDETGNETVINFTIDCTTPEIEIAQENTDSKNVAVTINLTDNLTGIDILKIATGEQDDNYFKNNGQQINIIKDGTSATGKINVTENGIYTAYTKDLAGNAQLQTFEVTTIDDTEEPEPNPDPEPQPDTTPPTINFEKEVSQDKKSVNLTINVTDTESQIQIVKMANGERDIAYFENNGEELQTEQGNKTATSLVKITGNGTYTVYAEDEAGNEIVETVIITEIEETDPEPQPDTTPPIITGVEDGRTYRNYVTPRASDENLSEVTLTRNGSIVEDYQNGDQIKENGNYILTAVDEAGNRTQVSFTIDIEDEDKNNTDNENTNTDNTNTDDNNNSDDTNTNNSSNNNTNTGEDNTNVDNNNNESTGGNTNNNESNRPSGNGNSIGGNSSSGGSTSGSTQNSQKSNTATTRLPYAGLRSVLIFAIVALTIVAGFNYIKYRKYRKF